MMWLLCKFAMIRHKWIWIMDVMDDPAHYCGIYQCKNCGDLSRGQFQERH